MQSTARLHIRVRRCVHIPPFTNNARVGPGDAGCALCGACRHEARAVVTGMTKLKAPTLQVLLGAS